MTNLRGNGNEFVNSGVVGLLHRSLEQDEGASEETSAPKKNESFLLLTTIIVGLIVVFYCVCTYQIMRIWLCKVCCGRQREDEDEEGGDTVVVHEGRLFNLSGNQRRAVLEAIFLEASKVRVSRLFVLHVIWKRPLGVRCTMRLNCQQQSFDDRS